MNFNTFIKSIKGIEKVPLPAEASQFKMSPPYRAELVNKQKELIKTAKKSAVLALFYPDKANETHIILILRKTYKGVHSAQVGFPGGKLEANETLEEAALREANEEVGVAIETVTVLKEMTQIYIPPSNFFVQPYMGISRITPNFVKQDTEVEALLEVKLSDFLNENNVVTKTVTTAKNVAIEVPAYNLNNHLVWGATAMMLSELKDLLKQYVN